MLVSLTVSSSTLVLYLLRGYVFFILLIGSNTTIYISMLKNSGILEVIIF